MARAGASQRRRPRDAPCDHPRHMRATEIASRLEGFRGRVAGSDAERRAANWLAEELAASGRDVSVEPFWCRPNWALAHCWHIALAVAGSLISVASAPVGAGPTRPI